MSRRTCHASGSLFSHLSQAPKTRIATARPCLSEWWSSRLVATPSEKRLIQTAPG
jgi:hypothetical protein